MAMAPLAGDMSLTQASTTAMKSLHMDEETVRDLARKVRSTVDDMDSEGNTFASAELSPTTFIDFKHGDEVVTAHEVVHRVAKASLRGVQKDLNDFAAMIDAAGDDNVAVDQLSADALLRLAQAGGPDHGEANHDDAVRDFKRKGGWA